MKLLFDQQQRKLMIQKAREEMERARLAAEEAERMRLLEEARRLEELREEERLYRETHRMVSRFSAYTWLLITGPHAPLGRMSTPFDSLLRCQP